MVEAIVEDLGAKRGAAARTRDRQPGCILASNTSSLSITALAAGMKHPGRVVGMHFFNPAPLMTLVEVVRGLATAPEVAADGLRDRRGLGQDAGVRDVHAGLHRQPLRAAVLRRGVARLAEGAADPATIDAVMREAAASGWGRSS